VDDELLALIERRLAPAERARVLAHLAACARCRAAASDLNDTVDGLKALPYALRAVPVRAAQQWPDVWARVRAGGPAHKAWPQVSVYLSLVTGLLVLVSAIPGRGAAAPARVTAGVAAGPQLTQAATVVYQLAADHAASTGTAGELTRGAQPTLAGTAAIAPVPIPTPVPGP
jgi:anti-sigma factor RsiW